MKFQRLILFAGTSTYNGRMPLDQFKKLAETAAEIGFTHIDLGCAMIERSRHQLTNNGHYVKNYDFYPEYTAAFPGFFKFYVPEALRAWLPEETAKRNLESMHERAIALLGPETQEGWRIRGLRALVRNIRHMILNEE